MRGADGQIYSFQNALQAIDFFDAFIRNTVPLIPSREKFFEILKEQK